MFCQRPTWPLPGMSKGEPLPNMENSETHIYGPPPYDWPRRSRDHNITDGHFNLEGDGETRAPPPGRQPTAIDNYKLMNYLAINYQLS